MFNRSRSYIDYAPGYANWIIENVWSGPDSPCWPAFNSRTQQAVETLFPLRYSAGTIQDYVVVPKVRHSFRRPNPFSRLPMAVKPVHHTKVSLNKLKDVNKNPQAHQDPLTIVQQKTVAPYPCYQERTKTQTCPPIAWLAARVGIDYLKNTILDGLPRSHSGIEFATPEWASLMDKFDEISKALVPSNFFAGEAFAEGGIYLDAIRLVTNPSRAITGFIKNVRKRGLHRLDLGSINKHYRKLFKNQHFLRSSEAAETARDLGFAKFVVKEAIDQHLSFQFGVVPAVHDFIATVDAHESVESHLRLLSKHRGRYFPIRVKTGLPAEFTPGTLTSPYVTHGSVLTDAFTVLSVFGQGRVRGDINEASRWRAYAEYFGLNKVVGTAWELIPFSFVADWFTNSQELVNSLTRIPLGESPFMNLASVGHSIKNIAVYDYLINPGYDQVNGYPDMTPDTPFPAFGYAVSDYTRVPGFPDTSWFANLSNLGSFHSITGGELLIQKFLS